jgi:hypothetical protein
VVTALGERLGGVLPRALTAGALCLAGWVLARLLRVWVAKGVTQLGRLVGVAPLEGGLRRAGIERPLGDLLGAVVFWGVLLVFVATATDVLGLPLLAAWLGAVSHYLPRLLVAVLIVVAGALGGGLTREAVRTAARAAGLAQEALIGRVAQAAVLVVAVVTAVEQVEIDIAFLATALLITFGVLAASVALAFALGARTAVSNIIACHYLRQTHRVGHAVRIGAVEGRIVEFTTGAVILEGPDGRILVPAKEFSESVSSYVAGDGR